MSYILAVNPGMFSVLDGMSTGAVFTATALVAIFGSLLIAFVAKMPFAIAPGMGSNAFFRIYCMYRHEIFMAIRTDSRVPRRHHYAAADDNTIEGNHSECHP